MSNGRGVDVDTNDTNNSIDNHNSCPGRQRQQVDNSNVNKKEVLQVLAAIIIGILLVLYLNAVEL